MDVQLILKNRSYYKKRISFILKELPRITGTVLDLGCGEMILADNLLMNENVEYVGIDLQRFKASDFFIQMNAVQYISSTTRRFDYIFCLGLIDHLNPSDRASCIKNCLGKMNTRLIVNAANSDNIFLKLFRKTMNRENELFIHCKSKIYLLKIPFTQILIKLTGLFFIQKYFATEIVYFITPEI